MPDNISTPVSEILERKSLEARQQAYQEELERLRKEVEARSNDLLKQWLAGEEIQRQEQLKVAETERANQERSLKNREQEFFRQIEEEERRKAEDYRRRKEDEERRRKEEEERKRKEEEQQLAAKKREAEVGHLTSKQIEALNKARKMLTKAETLIQSKNYEGALTEVSKALSLVPTMPEATELREKIRQSIREAKEAEAQVQEEKPADEAIVAPPRAKGSGVKIAIAVLLVIIVAVVVVVVQRSRHAAAERVSIAIIPWKVQSTEENLDYLGYGLSYRLTEALRSVPSLRVMGFSTAAALARSANEPGKQLAALGFPDYIIGVMKISDGQYKLQLDLYDSAGTNLWSQSFETGPEGLSKLNSQISEKLLSALGRKAEGRSLDIIGKSGTSNGVAFSAFLQGEAQLQQGGADNLIAALDSFQAASSLDPNFIDPLVGSATAYLSQIEEGGTESPALTNAEQFVQKALYINSSSPAALVARGRIHGLKREYKEAVKEFDGVLEVEPDMTDALLYKAQIYIEIGKYDDASDLLKQALNVDPRSFGVQRTTANLLQLQDQYHESMAMHEMALQVVRDSLSYISGSIADCMLYDPDLSATYANRVAAALKQYIDRNPDDYEAIYRLGRIQQVNGNSKEWLPLLNGLNSTLRKELGKSVKKSPALDMDLALVLTRIGNFPEAARYAAMGTSADKSNPIVYYKAAQMYAVQMFSLKRDQIDSTKRSMALENLRTATSLKFRIEEILSGDFFNFRNDAEFKRIIQLTAR